MDTRYLVGSVVSVPTSVFFHDNLEIMNTVNHNIRLDIYGVVMERMPQGEYRITWAITGLLGISQQVEYAYNAKLYSATNLTLIVTNINDDFDSVTFNANMHLSKFFRYSSREHKWVIYDWSLSCEFCRGLPKGYSGCQRENSELQCSMEHLYFDLQLTSNDEITNKTKANMCLNWYKVVTNMQWNQRIDICVKLEINRYFGNVVLPLDK